MMFVCQATKTKIVYRFHLSCLYFHYRQKPVLWAPFSVEPDLVWQNKNDGDEVATEMQIGDFLQKTTSPVV